MRKLVFSVVAIAMLATTALFAQEGEVKRTINGYLTADSGDMLGAIDDPLFSEQDENGSGAKGTFNGNEMEIGLSYSQNFASAQWLTARVRFNAVMNAGVANYEDGSYYGQSSRASIYSASPRGQVQLSANMGAFGVDGLSISAALDTRMKLDTYAYYGMAVGPGRLTFGIGAETYIVPRALDSTGTELSSDSANKNDPNKFQYYLDLFAISAGYSMKFTDVWGFNTTVYARFNGYDAYDATLVDNLELRWDLNATASFQGGLAMWAGIRLDVEDLLLPKERNVQEDANIDLKLRAGISYTFNI